MKYLILALITILGITISTLVTQSWGWGFIIWIMIGIAFIGAGTRRILTAKHRKNIWKKLGITLGIRIITGLITRTRLWSQDVHCRQTPDIVQGIMTVDSVWKAGESYLLQQGDYRWIYQTDQVLQPGQQVIIYTITDKLQTCNITYTHRDTGYRKLQRWIGGGDFDYDRWLVMKGVDGHVQGRVIIQTNKGETNSSAERNSLGGFKQTIISQITALFPNPRSAGRVGGTLLGTKDLIDKSDYELLIGSGLVHLIVVSGGNLALVILILGGILFWVPLYIRYGLIGLGLVGYVIIVGPDSSVLRALAMAIMTILGTLAGRKRSFGGMLSIATIILLWYNPMMIYDVGLRLSLGAVIGIYLTYQWSTRSTVHRPKSRWAQWTRQIFLVIAASIGARLGTLPVLIRQFGSANLTSIIANSVTGIIASITTIAELVVISLSSGAPSIPLTQGGVRIVDQLVSLIYQIAKLTVEWGVWIGASDQLGFWIITGSILTIFILLYHHTQKIKREYLLEIQEE